MTALRLDVTNPATGTVITSVPDSGAAEARAALDAAHAAVRTLVLTIFSFNLTFGAAWSVLVLYALFGASNNMVLLVILLVVGVVLLITAAIGFCPIWKALGINTNGPQPSPPSRSRSPLRSRSRHLRGNESMPR